MLIGTLFITSPVANAYVVHDQEACFWDDGGIFYPTHSVCVRVVWRTDGGNGVYVTDTYLICTGPYDSNPQVDGYSLKITNNDNVTKWYKGGADSNIEDNCYRHYTADVNMPAAQYGVALYNFKPRYNNQPDPDPQWVVLQFNS